MNTTTKLRDPHAATSLDNLCEILTEWADAIAHDEHDVEDYPDDLTSLPTFGGEEPDSTEGIWSWDAGRVLKNERQIAVGVTGWDVVPRPLTVIGEYGFGSAGAGHIVCEPTYADAVQDAYDAIKDGDEGPNVLDAVLAAGGRYVEDAGN